MPKKNNRVPSKPAHIGRGLVIYQNKMLIFMRWERPAGGRPVVEDVEFCCSRMAASMFNHRINSLFLRVVRFFGITTSVLTTPSPRGGEQITNCPHCTAEIAIVDRDNDNKRWQ